ncbi:hypothetical protein BDF21DRAFT_416325, partial [Thamnidium elegans]
RPKKVTVFILHVYIFVYYILFIHIKLYISIHFLQSSNYFSFALGNVIETQCKPLRRYARECRIWDLFLEKKRATSCWFFFYVETKKRKWNIISIQISSRTIACIVKVPGGTITAITLILLGLNQQY